MNRHRLWPVAFVVLGAVVQFGLWLAIRPDLAGPQWSDGHATETWLGLEAVAAVVLGALAPDRRSAVVAVLIGWGLQILHLAFLGDHYDDTLWGVGLFGQAFLAAVAAGLVFVADRLTSRG
jgi:hypothetical protein